MDDVLDLCLKEKEVGCFKEAAEFTDEDDKVDFKVRASVEYGEDMELFRVKSSGKHACCMTSWYSSLSLGSASRIFCVKSISVRRDKFLFNVLFHFPWES